NGGHEGERVRDAAEPRLDEGVCVRVGPDTPLRHDNRKQATASQVSRYESDTGRMTPDGDDRLRLDYDQTTQVLRLLTDIRFKLIAFVPTIAAFSVGLFGKPRPAVELLAIGLLGMTATLGILLYELRNSQIYAA